MYFPSDIDEDSRQVLRELRFDGPLSGQYLQLLDVEEKFLAQFGSNELFPRLLEDRVVDFYGESQAIGLFVNIVEAVVPRSTESGAGVLTIQILNVFGGRAAPQTLRIVLCYEFVRCRVPHS